ncbi:Putative spermidine/putrescine transport system permease protein [Hyphomicrobiales bacterium]|nr:Putative spermidine/putrescine transport system permease protein [Hyphomicrobiales bacterium]CAH1689230.1 putative spermidine/putrescine transport system permease protein [Hyphomicrobiales bacterium]
MRASSTRMPDMGTLALRVFTYIAMAFLFFPILITLLVSVNPREFILPPSGFTLEWFRAAWTSDTFVRAMGVSLSLGLAASIIANTLAFLAVLAMVRYDFKGKAFINLLIMSPLLIPTTIFSLALYVFFARLGFGAGIPALVIGHSIHVLPFAVRILTASMQNFDTSLEEAARNVGAGPLRTMMSITLPVIKTGLISSFVLCFVLSWNDFPISVFLAPPGWTPLPVELFSYIKFQYDAVGAALASSLILISGVAMVVIDRMAGLRRVMQR